MDNFNLMQVLPTFNSGGVEKGTLDLSNYLASVGMHNHIASNGGPMLTYLNKKYVKHYTLPVHSKNFFLKPFVALKLNKIIRKQKINILHIRSRAPAWLLPYISKKNIKTVSTFHNVYGNENFVKSFYNKQLSKVDKVVAISNFVKKEIIKNYKINSDKITVVNRGIDTNIFNANTIEQNQLISFLKKFNIDTKKKIILFPGRLTNWKGQIDFLKIVSAFKDQSIIFYFVGDDKNKSYLKKLLNEINNNNLNENCRVLGHLQDNDLKMLYYFASLVVSAPLKPEGFGRIVSETLSMKKIILSYNFGGAQNQLEGLDSLYKIEPYNVEELINRINTVLNLDINTINKMGEVAREYVVNNFSKEIMLKSYMNFYLEL